MKKLLILISFFLVGILLNAENCKVDFTIFTKNKSWKQVNSTLLNGIYYVDIESENDSLIIQLNKETTCSNTIGNFLIDDKKSPITPKGNEIKTNSNGGLYKIEIIGPGSSEWFRIFVRVTKPTSVKNNLSNANILIYPNPAKDNFIVENVSLVEQIKIIDIMGAEVLLVENSFKKDVLEIDISKLPSGQYFISFVNDKQKMNKKLVKL